MKDWSKKPIRSLTEAKPWIERGAQWGIVTGEDSDLVVLDIDQGEREPSDILEELKAKGCPRTLVVKTQSGGLHLYFKYRAGFKTRARYRPQLDVRAEGGQVVCPWTPGYQLLLDAEPAAMPDSLAMWVVEERPDAKASSEALMAGAERFVLPPVIRHGERNDLLHRFAWSLLAKDVPWSDVTKLVKEANRERCVEPLPETEVEAILASVQQHYQTTQPDTGGMFEEAEVDQDTGRFEATLREYLDRYVFVLEDNMVYDTEAQCFMRMEALQKRLPYVVDPTPNPHGGRPRTVFTAWLTSPARLTVEGVRYLPGVNKKVVVEGGLNWLNLWVKDGICPSPEDKEIDVSPWYDHLHRIMSVEDARYLTAWIAWAYRHPGQQVGHAVVVAGDYGVGKSWIGQVIRQLFGDSNVTILDHEDLEESYTDWAEKAQVVITEEVAGQGKWMLVNKLKRFITEPTVRIRAKYRQGYSRPNTLNFMFFSNYRAMLAVDIRDRRWWICWCQGEQLPREEYEIQWQWLRNGGVADFARHLMELDIGWFEQYRHHPPMTKAKELIARQFGGIVEMQLREWLEEKEGPFVVPVTTRDEIIQHLEAEGIRITNKTMADATRWINENLVRVKRIRHNGKRPVVLAVPGSGAEGLDQDELKALLKKKETLL